MVTVATDAVALASQAKPIQNPTADYGLSHDCVQLLSLNSDGSVAQYHPEILSDYTAGVTELTARFAKQEAVCPAATLSAMQAKHATVLADLAVSEGR
jgi:hypothetical protein